MSREIKFRAWSESNEKYLSHDERWVLAPEDGPEKGYRMNCCEIDWIGLDIWEAEDIVLEQYTGLKDNNGVEIYEGDILLDVRCGSRCGKPFTEKVYFRVYWDEFYFRWRFRQCTEDGWRFPAAPPVDFARYCNDYEVAGNIHENPELLEGEK